MSDVNFIGCRYNPGGLEHFLSELLWLESLFGNTAYLQDKVFVWVRNVFLAFSCNLDDIKRPNGTSTEQGNKFLFSLIKLLKKVFQICISLSIINSNCTRRNFEIKLQTTGTISEKFFAENFFLGFEKDKVLFYVARTLRKKCSLSELYWFVVFRMHSPNAGKYGPE